MSVRLRVELGGGTVANLETQVDAWFQGGRRIEITLPADTRVVCVEIDPDRDYPDIDRSNNVWPR